MNKQLIGAPRPTLKFNFNVIETNISLRSYLGHSNRPMKTWHFCLFSTSCCQAVLVTWWLWRVKRALGSSSFKGIHRTGWDGRRWHSLTRELNTVWSRSERPSENGLCVHHCLIDGYRLGDQMQLLGLCHLDLVEFTSFIFSFSFLEQKF